MRSAPSHSTQSSASILLVDDNHDGLMARQSVLQELGYKVISANCGREALKLAEQQKIDLIITDYKMGPVDGLELIEQLRRSKILTPVILLSGFTNNVGLSPENTGANVVLQKSADELTSLLRCIRRLLQPPRKPARTQGARPTTRSQKAGS